MDWSDWTYWTQRVGRWTNHWTHRRLKLQPVAGVVGYIHHGDDRVTGNDVLYYNHRHHGHHAACVHVGHHGRCILAVSEQFKYDTDDRTDKWNRNKRRGIWSVLAGNYAWRRYYSRIFGIGYSIYCLLETMLSTCSKKQTTTSYSSSSVSVAGGVPSYPNDSCFYNGNIYFGPDANSVVYYVDPKTGTKSMYGSFSGLISALFPIFLLSGGNFIFFKQQGGQNYSFVLNTGATVIVGTNNYNGISWCSDVSGNLFYIYQYPPGGSNHYGLVYQYTFANSALTLNTGYAQPNLGQALFNFGLIYVDSLAASSDGTLYVSTRDSGNAVSLITISPTGTISRLSTSLIDTNTTIMIDSDGLPVMIGQTLQKLYKFPLGGGDPYQIATAFTASASGSPQLAINSASGTIYVGGNTTINTLTPNY